MSPTPLRWVVPGRRPPEAIAAIERTMDIFAAETGRTRSRSGDRTCGRVHEQHMTASGAMYDSGDYRLPWTVLDAPTTRRCGQSRPSGARSRHRSARHRAVLLRRDHRRRRGDRARRTRTQGGGAPRRDGDDPDRHVAARPGPRDRLGDAGQRGTRHPDRKIRVKWGDTDLVPEGGGTGGSRSLQQGGAAVQQASQELLEVAGAAAARLGVSAEDLASNVPGAFAVAAPRGPRSPSPSWPRPSRCRARSSSRPGRPTRSARTWRSSR